MVKISGQQETVRLIGIDTPETVDPRKPVQCFGKEASMKAKGLVEGEEVILESDPSQGDKDKYGRLLRYVFLKDGTSVNQKMIEDGYAFEYTYKLPYKYQEEFRAAQKQAETDKIGLWADNACPVLTSTTTPKPTLKPQPTKTLQVIIPTSVQTKAIPYIAPATINESQGSWACDCSKTCPNMSSCAEAQYQLNTCGCQARDGDKDGIACDGDCQ